MTKRASKITIKCVDADYAFQQRVVAIKALRIIKMMGLKEAKDMIDSCIKGETLFIEEHIPGIHEDQRDGCYNLNTELYNLRVSGFTADVDVSSSFQAKIENLAKEAINAQQYQIAIDLLGVLRSRFSSEVNHGC